ncbi:MAG: hypothetical protein U9P81_06110 [Euryarchaeota archaeon]|nr:hypothetical protein [Euryarchaeota archaeon]
MIPRTINLLLALLLISIAGIPIITAAHEQTNVVDELSVDMEEMENITFTKLQISPSYSDMELQPGESDNITVKVINKDNITVLVDPIIVEDPYSEYFFDEEWIDITPSSTELEPEAEIEFTIRVEIPDDVECGYYNVQIAFTDDVVPTSYEEYINSMHLYIDVWKPPVIQMHPSHIYDHVESGKDYDYEVNLKNTGDVDIEIEPEFVSDRWYGYYGMMMPAFTDDAIIIDAPSVVPANGTATVNIHLIVPENAKGWYEGGIDMNFDDSPDEWERIIDLSFKVWAQPTDPFIKSFTSKTDAPITIEISSDRHQYNMCGGGSNTNEEPSFDVTLKGPSGDYVELNLTMTGYYGSVSLGGTGCTAPWEMDSSGIYEEYSTSYVERYSTNGTIGEWELGILSHYVEEFEYTIDIEDTD